MASRGLNERGAPPPGRAQAVVLDLSEAGTCEDLIIEFRPHSIINCAALARPDLCESSPELAQTVNAGLPDRLARLAFSEGIRLVHVSTDLVFDGEPPRPSGYRESDPASPVSTYGLSKLEGDRRILEGCPSALVVRLPLLYGGTSGEADGASGSIAAALKRGKSLSLFTDEYRTPLDVSEAARAMLELDAGEARGLLHVGGPRSISRFDLGLLVLRNLGIESDESSGLLHGVTRQELDLKPQRPRDVSLDSRLARDQVSFRLSTPEDRLLAPGFNK